MGLSTCESVARIERVPSAAEIYLDPRGKIIRWVRWRKANICKVTGAITRRNVQTATKGDGKMSVITADPATLAVCFKCSSGCTGVLVTEGYVTVYEVADSLHPRPAEGCMSEEAPGLLR